MLGSPWVEWVFACAFIIAKIVPVCLIINHIIDFAIIITFNREVITIFWHRQGDQVDKKYPQAGGRWVIFTQFMLPA
jgi:hypothetical protein